MTLHSSSISQAFQICRGLADAENAPYSLYLKCGKSNPPDGIELVADELVADNQEIEWQTSMRLRLLSHYMQYLTLAVNEGDIIFSNFDHSSMNRIVDSILLGTPSERLEGDLLYAHQMCILFHDLQKKEPTVPATVLLLKLITLSTTLT